MRTPVTSDQLSAKLNTPGPELKSQPTNRLPAPTSEQPMSLTLDQLRPYDRNPRTHENSKYEEIKESIRAVGLKQKLSVTQRPGDDRFMISDGGNTRLKILNELYQETNDKRYFVQDCHFVPWQGEINVLAGHLAENDNRGQLSWIERARGIYEAKRMIDEGEGEPVSQRELVKLLRDLGYTIGLSHISKMLYTVDHFLPTLPLTLEAGMGKGQIERLISIRQFCLECWTRCEKYWEKHTDDLGEGEQWAYNVIDGDFGQAWHEEMSQLDAEGQTDFRWNIVEDRLKGMIHDVTGLHFNPVDMAWKKYFTVKKHGRSATPEERNDIWTTVDNELERLRKPEERHLYPPIEGDTKKSTKTELASSAPADKVNPDNAEKDNQADTKPTVEPTDNSTGTEPKENTELNQMRSQLEQLEQRNAELEAQSLQATVVPASPQAGTENDLLIDNEQVPKSNSATRSAEEQETIVDDLTLSAHHESEGHRQLRHWQASQHGEEPVDFEAAALKSVPLQVGGSIAPITDLWHVPAWRCKAQDLRMQIGELIQALAEWSEIEANGTSEVIRLTANDGYGFELGPLNGSPSRRAQMVWQLLASIDGAIDPMLPNDIALLGELIGSHGDDESVRLPDGLLVRIFRLIRLVRVLRSVLTTEGENT